MRGEHLRHRTNYNAGLAADFARDSAVGCNPWLGGHATNEEPAPNELRLFQASKIDQLLNDNSQVVNDFVNISSMRDITSAVGG